MLDDPKQRGSYLRFDDAKQTCRSSRSPRALLEKKTIKLPNATDELPADERALVPCCAKNRLRQARRSYRKQNS